MTGLGSTKSTAYPWTVHPNAASSDTSSIPENGTADFTPAETPPRQDYPDEPGSPSKDSNMDQAKQVVEPKTEGSLTKEEVQPLAVEGKTEVAKEPKELKETKSKKPCKKHHETKTKKSKSSKSKKVESSDSDSSSSSSDSDTSSESEDLSEEEGEDARRKRRKKQKKMKEKKAAKKKARKQKKAVDSDDDSESDSSQTSSSEDEKRKARRRKSKKQRKESSDSESEEAEDDSLERRLKNWRMQGRARGLGRAGRGGRAAIEERKKVIDKKGKGKKKGSKSAYFRVDQLWDNTIHNYKLTETADRADEDEYGDYIFHVRRKFDWEGKYTETVVDIKSKGLKEALTHVMGSCKAVSLAEETPVIDPNMLFLYLEELREYRKELKALSKSEAKKKARKSAALQAAQVKALLKYLDKDYAEIKKTLYPLLASNTITFDLLWALYKPNTIAYTPTYSNPDEPRAFKIEYATKESSFMKGTWYEIEGRYLEYDGKAFGMGTMEVEVEAFKGPRKITSLACYPLKYHKDAETIKAKLIERGKKFVALKGMQYKFHKGMAFYKKKRQVIKVNINGRVMCDPAIFRRINPNYPISTVKPEDPDLLEEDRDSDDESCNCCNSDDDDGPVREPLEDADKPRTRMKLVMDEDETPQIVEVEVDENGNEVQKEKLDELNGSADDATEREFSEEELLIASPVVLGFAFSEKLWLEFTVSGVKEVDWNEGAFDSLVLPENQKSIVKALVESHTFQGKKNIDDVIQGKGRGLVAVLHGNPGTGKTLTAEGIAELLKCPLYMVSAGELGTNPRELEAELTKILDIAHAWGAVLLLDEADVFLEKRTVQDIHRNALVSIFLRLLEYFQGILFLTTNRVETFDDAFQSRIHVALRYSELNPKARRAVWKMFLVKVKEINGVETAVFKDSDLDKLAKHNLNGRQIKNAVRTAQALAVNEGKPLCMMHISKVLDVAQAFEQDLKGGTGYMDAMRSYT